MLPIDPSWVLAMMLKAEPTAAQSPWRNTYEATATAFALAAAKNPLFGGEDGAQRTAAMLVSVAWFESRFRQDAEGDHVKLADGAKGRARSVCALQIHETNWAALGVTRESLKNITVCAEAGLRMMHASFAVCRAEPLEHRLDHYAVGGNGCTRPYHDEGGHRVRKAMWLFRAVPPTARPS